MQLTPHFKKKTFERAAFCIQLQLPKNLTCCIFGLRIANSSLAFYIIFFNPNCTNISKRTLNYYREIDKNRLNKLLV